MTRRQRVLAVLGVFLVGGIGGWLAAEAAAGDAPGPIALQAQIIYASAEPGGIDSRLGNLAANLEKTFRYSRYQLLDAPKGAVGIGQAWKTTLPGERAMEVVPTGIQDGQYSLNVRILGAGGQAQVSSIVRLKRASTVLIGGPSHQQGVLIIAISVN